MLSICISLYMFCLFVGKYTYMYMYGENARLEFSVPSSDIGKLSCLKFYYHMYGATINTLNVYNRNTTIFTKSGNQANEWLMANFTMTLQNIVRFYLCFILYVGLFIYISKCSYKRIAVTSKFLTKVRTDWAENFVKEAQYSFFRPRVMILKMKIHQEANAWFPPNYKIMIKIDHSLTSYWFLSNRGYHSNHNRPLLFSNNPEYTELPPPPPP